MKKITLTKVKKGTVAIGICLNMLLAMCACGQTESDQTEADQPPSGTATVMPAVSQETAAPTSEPPADISSTSPAPAPLEPGNAFSDKAKLLIDMGIVPEDITKDPGQCIRWDQMALLISNVVEYCDAGLAGQWKDVAAKAFVKKDEMTEDGGAGAIYEAACVLGLGADNRAYWNEAHAAYESTPFLDYEDVFPNFQQESPVEAVMGDHAGWNYLTGAMFYAQGLSSAEDPTPLFGLPKDDNGYIRPLTCEKAIVAAYRLLLAYQDKYEGSYRIPETDWSDPLLAEAKIAKDSILNSETAITRGDEFVLGSTYNGTAYYVSNSGNDDNDGLSPDTAWASLDKVANHKLAFGDAVFFRRGDTWYGNLWMQAGVSYSAYGSGSKPIITGSPADASDPSSWQLYGQTADGGKIWKYHEAVSDVGVMLFNKESLVGKKVYPQWDGSVYTNRQGEPFTLETGLCGDLMFYTDLNLEGQSFPVSVSALQTKGTLYLRCDAGNPGDVFDDIEMSVISQAVTTAPEGNNAIDNIHFKVYAGSGADCCSHDNIIYQNCEVSLCGGAIQSYSKNSNTGSIMTVVSGGGILLFGSHVAARNNYVHDCENKGIAIVINGGYGDVGGVSHASLERVDVQAQNNVIERCGSAFYMMMEFIKPGSTVKFGDIHIDNNYVIHAGYGWRVHNMYMQGNENSTYGSHCEAVTINNIEPTGDVIFSNNLFYEAAGPLILFSGKDFTHSAVPTMQSNTYVQDENHIFFVKVDQIVQPYRSVLTLDQLDRLESCVKNEIGDQDGTVVIHKD